MSRETKFVEVILPLALRGTFTYRVPFEWNDLVKEGIRVIVQLGKKKLYSGIIAEVHTTAPTDYQAKYLEDILDENQVVTSIQINFWKWISEYYMCSLGEVMSAALPASLKLASETKLLLDADVEFDHSELNKKEALIIEALSYKSELTLQEISTVLEIKTVMPTINNLIKKGLVVTLEEFSERVKPKLQSYVELTDYSALENNQHEIIDELQHRAFKQLELFLAFLQLQKSNNGEVRKKDLLTYSGKSDGILKALRDKNILRVRKKEVSRIAARESSQLEVNLSNDQEEAFQRLKESYTVFDTCLFHGVTSSGKTEVYSELIDEAVKAKKMVLYLVPEIALTTQLIKRLQKRFGDLVGVYHSKFNQGERSEVWTEALKGDQSRFKIFVGARSSIFLPFVKLGLIVVDEEHDSSYKQFDPAPRYNARDLALVLAKLHGAKTLLGSATPALESRYNAINNKYGYVQLNKRFGDVQLPEIRTVDLREQLSKGEMKEEFSSVLIDEITTTLSKGEQVILFQNRRGYSPVWQCVTCGDIPQCTRCDVSLNYHKPINALKCHYCGYQISPAPVECNVCSSKTYKMVGFGTQKLEEQLDELFPDAQVQRMDFDTTRAKNGYETIINEFESGYTDILVGTQMVSKGLDFDNVGLVGVLQADHMLKFPDFRANERSFNLMSQVSGRAGRRSKRGFVIIQSYFPEHEVILNVQEHDYDSFYNREIQEREKFLYPPYYRLIKLTIKHKNIEDVNALAKELGGLLRASFGNGVLGPEFPAVIRIQNLYLKNILIKFKRTASPKMVKDELNRILDDFRAAKGAHTFRIKIDVDPQ